MHQSAEETTQSLVYIGIPVPLLCISISISASIPISVPISVSFSVLVSFSISVPVSVPVFVPVSAVVVVVVVMIVCRIVIRVVCPWWNMLVMPVLPVAFVVLLLIVFPDVWLAVPAVMLVVVVVVMVVVAVMMVVVMAPVVIASLLLVLLHYILHLLLLPLLWLVPAGKPLAIIPAGLYFHATGCLVVLGVAVMLHPAVVVVVMVMVVGVLGSLWFSPQEPLFLFFLALLIPLLLCCGGRGLLV